MSFSHNWIKALIGNTEERLVIIRPTNWRALHRPDLGFMNLFSQMIERVERREPSAIPDLRRGKLLLVASDYSGQHDLAEYQVLSFLFADWQQCGDWERMRQELRRQYLSDGRRMSFKALRDKKKRATLRVFLSAANNIAGLSFSVLVHKAITSLFRETGLIDLSEPGHEEFSHWKGTSFEKMLRVVHLVGFFMAGLSREGQDVLWITDEDEIAANDDRLRELTKLCGNVSSHYIAHNMGHFRCGTTKSDDGSRQLEDLASIPDLIAGALSEVVVAMNQQGMMPSNSLFVFRPENIKAKTSEIMNWFSTNLAPLKRLVYMIEPVENSSGLSIKRLRFHGSNDSDWI
jgi:hypothetical protein